MDLLERGRIAAQLARAAVAWLQRDTRTPSPVPESPLFFTPREAAALVRDHDVVAVSGMGAHQHASIVYAALRESFETTGHPAGLTLMNVGGHGGRGVAPGTLEELGRSGLCTRLVTSHFETFRAMLELAETGECELQCIPFGVLSLLFDALGRGRDSILTRTGVGTFLDPRVGRGSPVADPSHEQLVSVRHGRLRYRIPKIDVAIFNAPAADRRGNLYVRHCAVVGESLELARAARRNGGRVIANVGMIVDEDPASVFLPRGAVDAIVHHPDTEQTAGVFHRKYWSMFTTESEVPVEEGLARVRFVNSLLPSLPRRTAADAVLARVAAATLAASTRPRDRVAIGTGMPEQVPPVLREGGLADDFAFLVESGVVGGLPAPGVYFGASLSPREIVSSTELFRRCYAGLEATCLGALEVDGLGNVNVSQRGAGPRHTVGPGGFIDFCSAADTIVFVCAWMRGGEIAVEEGRVRIVKRGGPKFVDRVAEVTFDAAGALAAGKRVFYATHVGLFRLGELGLELVMALPGIDVEREVASFATASVRLPDTRPIPRVPRALFSAKGKALGHALRSLRLPV